MTRMMPAGPSCLVERRRAVWCVSHPVFALMKAGLGWIIRVIKGVLTLTIYPCKTNQPLIQGYLFCDGNSDSR